MPTYTEDISLTGQIAIEASRFEIAGTDTHNETFFTVSKLDLSDPALEDDARVIMEVRTGRYGYEAFPIGTVNSLNLSARYPIRSHEIGKARIDIAIISDREKTKGDVIAYLRGIKLSVNGKPPSFLQFERGPLGERFWNFDPQEGMVTFNDQLAEAHSQGNIETMAPIVTQIIEALVFWYTSEGRDEMGDEYEEKVKGFIQKLINDIPEGQPSEKERVDFARRVADKYAANNKLVTRFNQIGEN